jgi:hypothetical protein
MKTAVLILALYVGAALAQQPAQKPEPAPAKPAAAPAPSAAAGATAASGGTSASLFSQLDRNRDGYLDKSELSSEAAQRGNWVAMDRDGDGRISRSEFRAIER